MLRDRDRRRQAWECSQSAPGLCEEGDWSHEVQILQRTPEELGKLSSTDERSASKEVKPEPREIHIF